MDASSEGLSEDGRDSAFEGSQDRVPAEKPQDLITMLANGTLIDEISPDGESSEAKQQSVDFSGDQVIIDPNLIRKLERNSKMVMVDEQNLR